MHEFAVADQIFQSCIETANHHNVEKIIEINVELGDFTLVVEELLILTMNKKKFQKKKQTNSINSLRKSI
ncbi:MAG: hydrogenase/urease maturation nickel metallochaperone HypA [Promethearchaeota archaeon]